MRLSLLTVPDHYPAKPRSVGQLYAELLEQAELADKLGYDTFFTAEHHFHEYGAVPDPSVLLSAMAQRTKRLRLGTAISVLTFRNPAHVAESYAMVDQLSGGRLTLGVGSGYLSHEYAGHGIDPATKREVFDANFAVLRKLFAGEAAGPNSVRIQVRPVQNPVPMPVAVLRPEAAYYVGRQGFDLLAIPYASLANFDEVRPLVAEHHRGLRESGRNDVAEASMICFHAYVAETDAKARADAAEAFDAYVASRLYAKRSTYDDAMRNGLSLMGSVENVVAKLRALQDMGVNHVMALHNFGALAQDKVLRSMRLLAEEALPRVSPAAARMPHQ
jgi:alkanesulfonate monooxygenase SsuD/methylene tetrahydromethanopterin reductase-like flavin-dependent oxidoreductase (luciferase family)